jgi:hypothetical protein
MSELQLIDLDERIDLEATTENFMDCRRGANRAQSGKQFCVT